ncbi:hypothetical protein GT204_07805 [Streptomyces sp. SID4919]|uniref:hypothetical protein n=1 Tax=unclassified Streptomyces TaxID=2593676 RepID=UPI0008238FC6|nr:MULTISPECIES: hypothetical protein [unclassified Streptomyces]MYY08809.1 hypothetical protein [Streptomyces sp. SID4919]SCK25451.1 hypothetical protein YW7DRAFT_01944 [Streptomyces sp. AmelKG-E11A]
MTVLARVRAAYRTWAARRRTDRMLARLARGEGHCPGHCPTCHALTQEHPR